MNYIHLQYKLHLHTLKCQLKPIGTAEVHINDYIHTYTGAPTLQMCCQIAVAV